MPATWLPTAIRNLDPGYFALVMVRPAELTPAYWVFMGASAICVLAGAQIMELPSSPLPAAAHAVAAGVSVMLWAFGTWLVPFLVILGLWRHVRHRVPLAYEAGMWGIVFPLGMYGVASHELGVVLHVQWLVTLGRDEAWLALPAWAAVSLALAWSLAGLRREARSAGFGQPGRYAAAKRPGQPPPRHRRALCRGSGNRRIRAVSPPIYIALRY